MKMIAKDTKSRCRGGQDRQTPSSRRKPGPTDVASERLTINPGFPRTKSGAVEADPRARPCAGHPRLSFQVLACFKTWITGAKPGHRGFLMLAATQTPQSTDR